MQSYLDLVNEILEKGKPKGDRTGTGTTSHSFPGLRHEMSEGFPLLTTKKMPPKMILVELEGFLNGITDKEWYQERCCPIWNEWASKSKVPYSHDEETKQRMFQERDLGPIYGFQWRHFGAKYGQLSDNSFTNLFLKGIDWVKNVGSFTPDCEIDYSGRGFDQLERIVNMIDSAPDSRDMLISAWNPNDLDKMALPPCHTFWQVLVNNGKLDLGWYQRSVDTMVGLPFNIASYATVLHLLANHFGLEEGTLKGAFGDAHIYNNHSSGVEEQLSRTPSQLPQIKTKKGISIFDWTHEDSEIIGYDSLDKIGFEIAV